MIEVLKSNRDLSNHVVYNKYRLIDSVLYKIGDTTFKRLLVEPSHLRETILKSHHDSELGGHVKRLKMYG